MIIMKTLWLCLFVFNCLVHAQWDDSDEPFEVLFKHPEIEKLHPILLEHIARHQTQTPPLRVWCLAARWNRFEIMQWMQHEDTIDFYTLEEKQEAWRAMDNCVLRWGSYHGNLNMLQWAHSRAHYTTEDATSRNNEALIRAVSNQHIKTVCWLFATFELTAEHASAQQNQALRYATLDQNDQLITLLYALFSFNSEHLYLDMDALLGLAIELHNTTLLQHLQQTFQVNPLNYPGAIGQTMQHACEQNLVDGLFALQRYVIRDTEANAFGWSDRVCMWHAVDTTNINLVKFLVWNCTHCRFIDRHEMLDRALQNAENTTFLDELHSVLNFTVVEVVQKSNMLLRHAIASNRPLHVKWLQSTFSLTRADAQTWDNWALHKAVAFKTHKMLRVWHESFGLNKEDAQTFHSKAFRIALDAHSVETLRYLHTVFGLNVDDANEWEDYACQIDYPLDVQHVLRSMYNVPCSMILFLEHSYQPTRHRIRKTKMKKMKSFL